ncbi:MFS transporter [Vallicoccus soli]|uniref:DHA2 family efflux MFS transporter permease subunit n=1 Tax=Vallicoccus soli TaxID=2339232 RepID=A0A3A3Z1P4_9ACTN|nr:MFS transporter [Vallicoccus soli]RJK97165.1 DHA2 family efflux MFS transporter permease subunit [Vallicoccus soli]
MSTSSPPAPGADVPAQAPARLGVALFVIAMAQLMIVLDASIVNIALPSIQTALDFSGANLAWVVNGYTLAFGGLLLLGGRAGDLFGRRRVFVAGILLFTVASLLGGFAQGEASLIAARVLQGAGAAIASPTALSLITTTFPEGAPRNRAMAVYAAMSGAGAAVGLIAGGLLTDYLDWRWTLWVNVPIGLAVAFVAPRVLVESERETGRIDLPGAVTGTLGLTALVYGITRAAEEGWGDGTTLALFAASALVLAAFVVIEARSPHALMPLRLFRNRNRSGSYGVMLLVGGALFSSFYFISLYLQQILGYDPIEAGLAFLPFTVGIVVGAGLASQLATRVAPRVLAGTGLALAAVGLFLYTGLEPDSSYVGGLLPSLLVTSVGMGLTFVPLTLTAVSGVAREDSGIASALLNTAQQVGGSLGLAVLATVATSRSDALLPQADVAFFQGLATQDLALVGRAADALTDGYTRAFLVGSAMVVVALLLTLAAVNARRQEVAPEGGTPVHVG